jgi:photosystem II stability/assembly factor-like uncharacterized protein
MARKKGFLVGMIALFLFAGVAPRAARAQLGQWTSGLSEPAGSVIVDPSDPWRLYSIAWYGAALTSADGGASWEQMTLPFQASSVAVSPSRLGALYAFDRGGSGRRVDTRLFQSSDNGIGWSPTAFQSRDYARTVAVDPRKSSTVYAGTSSGLSRSTDGGASWEDLKLRAAETRQIYEILFPPRAPSTVYVLDADYSYYPQFTLDKSTDGGATWSTIAHDLSTVAIDPFDSSTLYGITDSCQYFLRSTDAGRTWTSTTLPSRNSCVSKVVADPVRPGHLYAGWWGGGVMRSRDGGTTWEQAGNGVLGNVAGLAIDPAGLFLHAATSRGIFDLELAEPQLSPCEAGPERLCLLGGRFEVSVKYGDSAGRAVPQGDRFGAFRRPGESPAEAEIFVKMADHRAAPNRAFWFFHSSVTDLSYTITVRDTASGRMRFYRNESANPGCGAADTGAFLERSASPSSDESRAGSNLAPGEGDTLSLVGGRYQVKLSVVNPFTGADDAGLAMPQTDRLGYFSFPSVTGDPTFPEVFVSLSELRPGDRTFSHTGLTNLQYTLTLTDRDTGSVATYRNDRGHVFNLCGGSSTWIDF